MEMPTLLLAQATKNQKGANWLLLFCYGFEPVFFVEKNKKTTSYAGG
ncbi:hypothetical protein SORDD17_00882 [Streptococcus oralis]|uniref:Uncharacterized protein n=1 Tax=Streptococcus oralis TaxID=1303 RepID=A0A139RM43_STROR|nr:hypothetical protein SORDD17_00882 [Streptococcus oralis]